MIPVINTRETGWNIRILMDKYNLTVNERFPDRTVGAHRQRNVIRREDRTESEGEIRLPRRQRDVLDHEIVRRRVVEHLGVGFSRSPGVFARRTVIVIVDTDIVHGIGHRRGSRAGLGFPLC